MIKFLGYEEIINSFTFRQEAALTIPKEVREVSYTLSLDLEIVSVAREGYKNFKSKPAHGFYGYAILVMQDFTELKIEIENSRQRLYYGRLDEAFVDWYSLFLYHQTEGHWESLFDNRLTVIDAAVGAEGLERVFTCPPSAPFVELPLREVYVKCPFGTTIRMEVAYWKPKPASYGGCEYDGKSGQIDGDKDGGLPPNGTQPAVADDPNNPYSDFPPPSSDEALGSFKNDKLGTLDNVNPDNDQGNVLGSWLVQGVYQDYQDLALPFDFDVVVTGFSFDNPRVIELGFNSPACPYKTVIRSSFDGRNMSDVGCSSKVLSQSAIFTPS